ncbi:MAG: hypothetical protein KIS76_02970 [Pyrinomonadaceae bacterium]|nr:hypothetical protein [Pyrinomonadaceae bacterium]
MSKSTRLAKSFFRLVLPVVILIILVLGGASIWLLFQISQPFKAEYLVTPTRYGQLSTRGAKITDETWTNKDGTSARGWLLRGSEGAPAVLLMHRYGADRSHVLDLGVKINEATNFTVLMPDLRGHGIDPLVAHSSLGASEGEDANAAIEFVRGLKTESSAPLVGENIGIYGVALGALGALDAAKKDSKITALVLDSVPQSADQVLETAISKRYPFMSAVTSKVASAGTYLYFIRTGFDRSSACDKASDLADKRVLLLGGADAPDFQAATEKLTRCFPQTTPVESKLDFNPSGFSLSNATVDQLNVYDQRVIEFLTKTLKN